MKAVILAGGMGSRIAEETHVKPKPMIEIGEKPIIWHIMKIYSAFGVNDFIICLGFKGYMIKEYFANYYRHMSDITFDFRDNTEVFHNTYSEPWRVTLVNTGMNAMTGGRLKAIEKYVKDDDCFCMTYGDGVADVNIQELISFHKHHGNLATVTGILPPGRFGALNIREDNHISAFQEKPVGDGSYINGGFFVLSPKVLSYIQDEQTIWEREPMERLADDGQLMCFKHHGFWQPMDTLRDKILLDKLWEQGNPPWRVWEKNDF